MMKIGTGKVGRSSKSANSADEKRRALRIPHRPGVQYVIHWNEVENPFENGPIVNGGGFTYGDTMYPNGENQNPDLQVHDVEIISGTTIGGTTRLKGGNFPCGLMRL